MLDNEELTDERSLCSAHLHQSIDDDHCLPLVGR